MIVCVQNIITYSFYYRREGGLNSIISQLHNKQAICGSDVKTGNGEESLDLTIRTSSSSTSPAAIVNGRKRLREVGQKHFIGVSKKSVDFNIVLSSKLTLHSRVNCKATQDRNWSFSGCIRKLVTSFSFFPDESFSLHCVTVD